MIILTGRYTPGGLAPIKPRQEASGYGNRRGHPWSLIGVAELQLSYLCCRPAAGPRQRRFCGGDERERASPECHESVVLRIKCPMLDIKDEGTTIPIDRPHARSKCLVRPEVEANQTPIDRVSLVARQVKLQRAVLEHGYTTLVHLARGRQPQAVQFASPNMVIEVGVKKVLRLIGRSRHLDAQTNHIEVLHPLEV